MSTRQKDSDKKNGESASKGIHFSRRSFFKGLVTLGMAGGFSELLRPERAISQTVKITGKFFTEPSRNISIVKEVDVLVVGGGMAGASAAIASRRMGLKTLLIEYFGYLGGNATNALINDFCGFYTRTNNTLPVVKGIGGEIVQELIALGGGRKWRHVIDFDPEILKLVLDKKVIEAKVEPLYYTQMVLPIIYNKVIKGIIIENKGGRQAIMAKMVLDCSGDGDVCALADVPFELGDGKGGSQACDMGFRIANADKDFEQDVVFDKGEAMMAEALKSGGYKLTRIGGSLGYTMVPGIYWANMARVPWAVNGVDPDNLTRSSIEGRQIVREFSRFLKDKVPGLGNISVVQTGAKVGLRETRRVLGEHLLSAEEVLSGTKFDDGIAGNAWPLEVHIPGEMKRKMMYLKGDDYHTIPYRSLVPQKVDNLLMAGRFISCTHDAQASIRVVGPASAMGQAAGTAAALAIKEKVVPRKLNVKLLQKELEKAGAFLG